MMSCSLFAVVEVKEFSSEELRERFQTLVNELRCPKCQNQNLADSNSPISMDLRAEIFRMLEEGKSDQEIVDFLVARYGEFVMYRPPVKKTTLILWLAPALFVVVGVLIVLMIRRRQSARYSLALGLESDEQARLDQLLGNTLGEKQEETVLEKTIPETSTSDNSDISTKSSPKTNVDKPDNDTNGDSK